MAGSSPKDQEANFWDALGAYYRDKPRRRPYTNAQHAQVIAELKAAQLDPRAEKSARAYYLAKSYEVMVAEDGQEKLIKKSGKNVADAVEQVVMYEELFSLTQEAHLATDHGNRLKMEQYHHPRLAIPRQAIAIYLDTCPQCTTASSKLKNKIYGRGAAAKRPLKHSLKHSPYSFPIFPKCGRVVPGSAEQSTSSAMDGYQLFESIIGQDRRELDFTDAPQEGLQDSGGSEMDGTLFGQSFDSIMVANKASDKIQQCPLSNKPHLANAGKIQLRSSANCIRTTTGSQRQQRSQLSHCRTSVVVAGKPTMNRPHSSLSTQDLDNLQSGADQGFGLWETANQHDNSTLIGVEASSSEQQQQQDCATIGTAAVYSDTLFDTSSSSSVIPTTPSISSMMLNDRSTNNSRNGIPVADGSQDGTTPSPSFTLTCRNRRQLHLGGYSYNKARCSTSGVRTYWACVHRNHCRGRVITNDQDLVLKYPDAGDHSHPPGVKPNTTGGPLENSKYSFLQDFESPCNSAVSNLPAVFNPNSADTDHQAEEQYKQSMMEPELVDFNTPMDGAKLSISEKNNNSIDGYDAATECWNDLLVNPADRHEEDVLNHQKFNNQSLYSLGDGSFEQTTNVSTAAVGFDPSFGQLYNPEYNHSATNDAEPETNEMFSVRINETDSEEQHYHLDDQTAQQSLDKIYSDRQYEFDEISDVPLTNFRESIALFPSATPGDSLSTGRNSEDLMDAGLPVVTGDSSRNDRKHYNHHHGLHKEELEPTRLVIHADEEKVNVKMEFDSDAYDEDVPDDQSDHHQSNATHLIESPVSKRSSQRRVVQSNRNNLPNNPAFPGHQRPISIPSNNRSPSLNGVRQKTVQQHFSSSHQPFSRLYPHSWIPSSSANGRIDNEQSDVDLAMLPQSQRHSNDYSAGAEATNFGQAYNNSNNYNNNNNNINNNNRQIPSYPPQQTQSKRVKFVQRSGGKTGLETGQTRSQNAPRHRPLSQKVNNQFSQRPLAGNYTSLDSNESIGQQRLSYPLSKASSDPPTVSSFQNFRQPTSCKVATNVSKRTNAPSRDLMAESNPSDNNRAFNLARSRHYRQSLSRTSVQMVRHNSVNDRAPSGIIRENTPAPGEHQRHGSNKAAAERSPQRTSPNNICSSNDSHFHGSSDTNNNEDHCYDSNVDDFDNINSPAHPTSIPPANNSSSQSAIEVLLLQIRDDQRAFFAEYREQETTKLQILRNLTLEIAAMNGVGAPPSQYD